MKNYLNYITAGLFLGLTVFASCGGGDDPDPVDPLIEVAENLTGTLDEFVVVKPANATALDWANLSLTITGNEDGGSYTTTGSADPTVWPASGTWEFNNTAGTEIRRNDDVVIDISINTTTLVMDFSIDQPAARAGVVEGNWKFTGTFQAE